VVEERQMRDGGQREWRDKRETIEELTRVDTLRGERREDNRER